MFLLRIVLLAGYTWVHMISGVGDVGYRGGSKIAANDPVTVATPVPSESTDPKPAKKGTAKLSNICYGEASLTCPKDHLELKPKASDDPLDKAKKPQRHLKVTYGELFDEV